MNIHSDGIYSKPDNREPLGNKSNLLIITNTRAISEIATRTNINTFSEVFIIFTTRLFINTEFNLENK